MPVGASSGAMGEVIVPLVPVVGLWDRKQSSWWQYLFYWRGNCTVGGSSVAMVEITIQLIPVVGLWER